MTVHERMLALLAEHDLEEDDNGRLWRNLGWIKDRIDSKLVDEYEQLQMGIQQLHTLHNLTRHADPEVRSGLALLLKKIDEIGSDLKDALNICQQVQKTAGLSSVASKS